MINKVESSIKCTTGLYYDADSMTAIETVGKLQTTVNEVVDETNKLSEQVPKKLDSKFYDADMLRRKLSCSGNFTGTWFGLKPTQADETLSSVVEELNERVEVLELDSTNVLTHGVDNTGLVCCAEIVQSILDNLHVTGSATIYFPSGLYTFSQPVSIRSNTEIKFSPSAVVKNSSPANTIFKMSEQEPVENVSVSGGLFIGNEVNATGVCFTAHKLINATFKNMHFFDAVYGGHNFDLIGCNQIIIEGCTFQGFARQQGREYTEAIQLDSSNYLAGGSVELFNCDLTACKNIYIKNNRFLPIYDENGIIQRFAPNPFGAHNYTSDYFHNIQFTGNYVENCQDRISGMESTTTAWCRMYAVDGLHIKDNYFMNTKSINNGCISVQTKSEGTDVDGLKYPLYSPPKNIHIEGNTFKGFNFATNAKRHAIILCYGVENYEMTNVTVNANTFSDCLPAGSDINDLYGTHTIFVDWCRNTVVANNTFDRVRQAFYSGRGLKGLTFTGNSIEECSYMPIVVAEGNAINITGNEFSQLAYYLWFDTCSGVIINSNTFDKCNLSKDSVTEKAVIRASGGSVYSISNNTFTNLTGLLEFCVALQTALNGAIVSGNLHTGLTMLRHTATTTNITETNNLLVP